MAFKDFPAHAQSVSLLQRSLERGRLAHASLFTGHQLDAWECLAGTLAKTLNCLEPVSRNGVAVDCCDQCLNCRKVEEGNHADVFWVRPESKLRHITIGQIARREKSPPRVLMDAINLKPTESQYKLAILVAADRMKVEAANAFLKTLEEPPPRSVLILLTTDPQQMLETILSRCLRLNFGGEGPQKAGPAQMEWLTSFSDMAAADQKSLLSRYRLLDVLLRKLTELKTTIEENLAARSPLGKHEDAEEDLRDRWEQELKAAVEAEYRRQRGEFLLALQWWLRDIWLQTLGEGQGSKSGLAGSSEPVLCSPKDLLVFPELAGTQRVARRISPSAALENLRVIDQLQGLLHTNVQEPLALEVGLLQLQF